MQDTRSPFSEHPGASKPVPWAWALAALAALAGVILALGLVEPGAHRTVALVVGMSVYAVCVRCCFRHGRSASLVDV